MPAADNDHELVLAELLEAIVNSLAAGQEVSLDMLKMRFPDSFEDLQRLLPTLEVLVSLTRQQ